VNSTAAAPELVTSSTARGLIQWQQQQPRSTPQWAAAAAVVLLLVPLAAGCGSSLLSGNLSVLQASLVHKALQMCHSVRQHTHRLRSNTTTDTVVGLGMNDLPAC
jgi:antibiotic biosynthesis monooxygenase (ABM) superfamily enzyme